MKTLVLNPSNETQSKLIMLDLDTILKTLVNKILGQGETVFSPILLEDRHIRRFISNVESKVVAVTPYSNKPVNTYVEAIDYFNQIGSEIYKGADWRIKALKTEIKALRTKEFGINVPKQEAIDKILTEFDDPTEVKVVIENAPAQATKPEIKHKARK